MTQKAPCAAPRPEGMKPTYMEKRLEALGELKNR